METSLTGPTSRHHCIVIGVVLSCLRQNYFACHLSCKDNSFFHLRDALQQLFGQVLHYLLINYNVSVLFQKSGSFGSSDAYISTPAAAASPWDVSTESYSNGHHYTAAHGKSFVPTQ